ncbi:MAG: hypothetical protein KDK37_09810 [Leptospiraceae bacterium]|nr:hypothetical protein [Leptospiraceae bacterium]MCB1304564.1 hypothetical protein [Leptospiraceae bacterium]
MSDTYFILIGLVLGLLTFLLYMLVPLRAKRRKEEEDRIRGYCPLCGHALRKGERIRSNQLEIGKSDLRTYIKGCPFCLGGKGSRKCPVCKKKVGKEDMIVAFSNPEEDKRKLRVMGCKNCFSQGFD